MAGPVTYYQCRWMIREGWSQTGGRVTSSELDHLRWADAEAVEAGNRD